MTTDGHVTGNDESGNGNQKVGRDSVPRPSGAAARLRLTRRVVRALEHITDAQLDADIENFPLPTGATTTPLLRTDLMVRALDLRIRLALLPGLTADNMDNPSILREAQIMLVDNPETASVALVADDHDLTCRIIEPFDSHDAIVAPTSAPISLSAQMNDRYGPVGMVLRQYLRHINPGWNPPQRVQATDPSLDESAREAASEALVRVKAQRKRTPEWRSARESIPHETAEWLADLALSILQGSDVTIDTELESYLRRRNK